MLYSCTQHTESTPAKSIRRIDNSALDGIATRRESRMDGALRKDLCLTLTEWNESQWSLNIFSVVNEA